jgi:lipid-binding SYLF domain-containing protein
MDDHNAKGLSMDRDRRQLLVTGASFATMALFSACTTTGTSGGDPAAERRAIDSAADNALSRLYAQQPGSRQLVTQARGVLVFPSFVSAGFVVGGASGTGVLRKAGRTASYHRMTEASVGLLAGAQSQAVFILFMTEEALQRFESSRGWTVGADASVSMISVGANMELSTQTTRQEVIGFVLTNSGLMGNLSLNGNRVTRLDL